MVNWNGWPDLHQDCVTSRATPTHRSSVQMDNLVGDYPSSDDDEVEQDTGTSSPRRKRERNGDGQGDIDSPAKKKAGPREVPTEQKPIGQKRVTSSVNAIGDTDLDLPPPPPFDSNLEPFAQTSESTSTAERSEPSKRQRNSMVPPQLSGSKPNLTTEDLENMGLRPQKGLLKKASTRPTKPSSTSS